MEAKSTDKILHNKNDNSVTTRNSKIRNNILMISLNKFYENPENLKKFNKILNGDSKISLRIIDWFVTNYSKKNNTTFVVYTKGKTMKRDHFEEEMSDTGKTSTKLLPKQKKLQFNVYVRYKAQLKSYSKKSFDPFCRKDRINDWGRDSSKKFVCFQRSILSEGINVSELEAVVFLRNSGSGWQKLSGVIPCG